MYLCILLLKLLSTFIAFEFMGMSDYDRFDSLNFIVFPRIDFALNLFEAPDYYPPPPIASSSNFVAPSILFLN